MCLTIERKSFRHLDNWMVFYWCIIILLSSLLLLRLYDLYPRYAKTLILTTLAIQNMNISVRDTKFINRQTLLLFSQFFHCLGCFQAHWEFWKGRSAYFPSIPSSPTLPPSFSLSKYMDWYVFSDCFNIDIY